LSKQNVDEEDFEEEQNLVARLVHHLACPNSEGQYRVLLAARRHFGQGGPKRLRHTLPPLIFSGLQLVRQLHAQSAEGEGP
jgi:vacuolar protein sorting-associated protein 35